MSLRSTPAPPAPSPISPGTGVPIIDPATKVMLGEKLKDLGYGTGLYP